MDYELGLALVGAIGIVAALLPQLLGTKPMSYPILYVVAGLLLGWAGIAYHPVEHTEVAERLTELGVILALMGSGLKLDRRVGWRTWNSTWRLLGITMVLTVVTTTAITWWAGLPLAAAVLAGAVMAPTDPVLASDVQVPGPGPQDGPPEERETRFALTSEAGLNDGLAFPFTYFALAFLAAGGLGGWVVDWVLLDVLYRIIAGLVVGFVMGRVLALVIFQSPGDLPRTSQGFVVLAMTLVTYGVTQLLEAYGFIAVFAAAVAFRGWEKKHRYHRILHDASEQAERSVLALLLVLFGAAITAGLLSALTWSTGLAALAVVLLVRPLAGAAAMLGSPLGWLERGAISFFGIRGIGSFYYLAFALNRGDFPAAEALWSFAGAMVLISIVVHGLTARPAMRYIHSHG